MFSVRGESPEMTDFLLETGICIIPQIIGMEEKPLSDLIGSEILLSVTSYLTRYFKMARKNSSLTALRSMRQVDYTLCLEKGFPWTCFPVIL